MNQGVDRPGVRQAPEGSGEQGGGNGENWLQNHLWCPNDPRGYGIDDDDDDDDDGDLFPALMSSILCGLTGLKAPN